MKSATGPGKGKPAILKVNHVCQNINHESGNIQFSNGITAQHDLIIGADGIGVSIYLLVGEYSKVNVIQVFSTCYIGNNPRSQTIHIHLLPLYCRD